MIILPVNIHLSQETPSRDEGREDDQHVRPGGRPPAHVPAPQLHVLLPHRRLPPPHHHSQPAMGGVPYQRLLHGSCEVNLIL